MSLSEDLKRLANCKTNIKQAIQDKGVQVTSDRFEQYPEFIRTIETSGGDKDYINNPKPDGNAVYYWCTASDGTVYVGSDSVNYSGLYAIKDGVATQLFDYGQSWRHFFKASDGTIYVGSDGSAGVYAIKDGVATQIITTGYGWQYFFEASDGTVYVGSSKSSTGLYAIKNGVATQIITTGYRWQYFFEASDGTVYVGSSYSDGVYAIKDGVATKLFSSRSSWLTFCELSNGIVLVGSRYSNGVYAIKNGVATRIITNISCGKITPIETGDNITVYITGTNEIETGGVEVIQYNKSESSWGNSTAPIATGVYDYVKPVPSTGEIICSSSTVNGIYVVNRSTSVQLQNSEQYKWMLYNDTFISTDRNHQYQYDDTDTLNPVKERTIELPESPKCFITIAKQNTYDV